jgi:hypothetical protein
MPNHTDTFNPTESVIPNDGDLVFDSTGEGGRSPTETVLPYIEQRVGEADNGGIIINWTSGDGPNGPKGDSVGVIAIITPTEHDDGGIIVSWTPSATGESERMAGFCATGQTSRDGTSQGIVINWASSNGSSHDAFPTETIHPLDVHSSFDLLL